MQYILCQKARVSERLLLVKELLQFDFRAGEMPDRLREVQLYKGFFPTLFLPFASPAHYY